MTSTPRASVDTSTVESAPSVSASDAGSSVAASVSWTSAASEAFSVVASELAPQAVANNDRQASSTASVRREGREIMGGDGSSTISTP